MHSALEILMNMGSRDVTWKFISYLVFKMCSEEAQTKLTVERTQAYETGPMFSTTLGLFALGFLSSF